MGFWDSISDGLSAAGHWLGDIAHQGLNAIESVGSSGVGLMHDAQTNITHVADGLVSGAEKLGEGVLKTGENIVGDVKSVISTPLIIIAGGLAFFLFSQNFGKAIDVGGKLGSEALKNPAVMGGI